jgi:hypothetical protein
MPSQALASTCLVEFELHGRLGRVEPELERSIAPRTVYRTVTSDTTTAAGLPGTPSKIDSEPQLFGCVRREAQLTSVSRSTPAERPYVGSVFYLLPVGLIAAAIIAVFFGIAFSGLTHPKGKTVIGGPVKAVSTAKGTTSPGDSPATSVTPAETVSPISHAPDPHAPPSHVSSRPVASKLAGPPGEPTGSASGGSRSRAHSATRRGGSAHHHSQPTAQTEKQRALSAMVRAHQENFDRFQSLTPPRAGARNPFDQLITYLTGQTKPVQSLTPP